MFACQAVEAEVASSLDGSHSVADLAVAGLADRGLRPDVLAELVPFLHRGGFLTTPWVDTYALIELRSCLRADGRLDARGGDSRRRQSSVVGRTGSRRAVQLRWAIVVHAGGPGRVAVDFVVRIGAFLVQSAGGTFTLLGDPTAAAAATLFGLQHCRRLRSRTGPCVGHPSRRASRPERRLRAVYGQPNVLHRQLGHGHGWATPACRQCDRWSLCRVRGRVDRRTWSSSSRPVASGRGPVPTCWRDVLVQPAESRAVS